MAAKKKKTKAKTKTPARKRSARQKSKGLNPAIALWAKRCVVSFVVLIVVLWGASWFILPHIDALAPSKIQDNILEKTVSVGFKVESILVEGREHTDPDILLGILNIQEGDPILSFDPTEAKEQIERIGWVKSARVERRLPGTIYVKLHERQPVALWQDGEEKLHLIDSDGALLTQKNLNAFKHLIMIKGEKAPEQSINLINILQSEPKIFEAVDHAVFLDKRRWDIFLKNGMQVKLPEKNVSEAVRHLMIREEQDQILSKDSIETIDARYNDRLIVKTRLGKVQDYKAGLNDAGTQL